MTDSSRDHEKLSRLFLEAAELDADRRRGFLDEACGGDAELRAAVESLLDYDRKGASWLATGEVPKQAAMALQAIPDRIGPYRILERLGDGGMGTVLLGEQEHPIRRTVAIKLIKLGIETEEVLGRFESERQALALMNHPNIAQVFEAGMAEQGRPFFAMEHVKGEPITDYCDTHRLSINARLELFRQVCDGVRHAHQKAIIHRDIKPSNILVTRFDGRPVPKIIDFGVAKALDQRLTERTLHTTHGQFVGTPEYMSPEQARGTAGAVDTRADVYSLGVLLYELLVGVLPFERERLSETSLDSIQTAICEGSVTKPSSQFRTGGRSNLRIAELRGSDSSALRRRLAGDLDWIVLKAMEKEVDRRYSSVGELADDLQRHQAHEPVLARPPSRVYRLRKLVRKNRAAVAVTSTVFLLLAGFSIAMAVQSRRLVAERAQVRHEAEVAQGVADFLMSFFTLAEPSSPDGWETIFEILDQASMRTAALTGDPTVRVRLLDRLATAYNRFGFRSKSTEALRQAADVAQRELGDDSIEALKAKLNLAKRYVRNYDPDPAEQPLDEVEAMAKKTLGNAHWITLEARIYLAYVAGQRGRQDLTETLLVGAIELAEPEQALGAIAELAAVYLNTGRPETARMLLSEASADFDSVLGPFASDTMIAVYQLACASAQLGEFDRALSELRQSLERGFWFPNIAKDPDWEELRQDPRWQALFADDSYIRLLNEARVLASRGDPARAKSLLLQAVEGGLSEDLPLNRDPSFWAFKGDTEFEQLFGPIHGSIAPEVRPHGGEIEAMRRILEQRGFHDPQWTPRDRPESESSPAN